MYIKEEEGSRGGPRTGWRSYDQTTNSVGTTAGQHGQEGGSAARKGTGEKGDEKGGRRKGGEERGKRKARREEQSPQVGAACSPAATESRG